jgi:hypothetical protein
MVLLRFVYSPYGTSAALGSIPYFLRILLKSLDPQNTVIVREHDGTLDEFVALSHSLVLDRLVFPPKKRKLVYRQWLKDTQQRRLIRR